MATTESLRTALFRSSALCTPPGITEYGNRVRLGSNVESSRSSAGAISKAGFTDRPYCDAEALARLGRLAGDRSKKTPASPAAMTLQTANVRIETCADLRGLNCGALFMI